MIYLALVDGLYNIGYCKNKEEIENKIFDSVEDCEEYKILNYREGTHKELKEIYKTLKEYRPTGTSLFPEKPKDGVYSDIEHFLLKLFPEYQVKNPEEYTIEAMEKSLNELLQAYYLGVRHNLMAGITIFTDHPDFKRYIILENGAGRVNIEQLKQDLL